MEKFDTKWKEAPGNRIVGFLLVIAGLIAFILGFGAWKNPHLDWNIFTQSFITVWITMKDEIARFIIDPFAFVGLIVMIVSLIAIGKGLRNLIKVL